jgi:hypothetical protein
MVKFFAFSFLSPVACFLTKESTQKRKLAIPGLLERRQNELNRNSWELRF